MHTRRNDVFLNREEFLAAILEQPDPAGTAAFVARIQGEDLACSAAFAADTLREYNPDEPRDSRGRWTTGGSGAEGDPGPSGRSGTSATPPYTPTWGGRAKGNEVKEAGGTVGLRDGRKIKIEVFKNAEFQFRKDGKIVTNDEGQPLTETGMIQFSATGTAADDCRWVQFYNNYEIDKQGKPLDRLNTDKSRSGFLSYNGQWVVDANHPGPGEKVSPDAVYLDQGDAACNRSATETSVLDRPGIEL